MSEGNRVPPNTKEKKPTLDDLLAFSKKFKLKTPVPKDIVGILTKDAAKQKKIIEKAWKDVEDSSPAGAKPASQGSSETRSRPAGVTTFDSSTTTPPRTDREVSRSLLSPAPEWHGGGDPVYDGDRGRPIVKLPFPWTYATAVRCGKGGAALKGWI